MSPLCLIVWVPTGLLSVFMALTDAMFLSKSGRQQLLDGNKPQAIFVMHFVLLFLVALSLDIAGVRL